jgi:hypothetical protein
VLVARAAPTPVVEVTPLWGFASGVAAGGATGLLAALSGGPLGSGRLAAVGPPGLQAAVVAVLEVGVAAAVTAGLANWLRVRRDPALAAARASRLAPQRPSVPPPAAPDNGHRIYLDPSAGGEAGAPPGGHSPPGPSTLP